MSDYKPKTSDELLDIYLRSQSAYLPQISTAPGSLSRLEGASIARLVADLHVRQNASDRNITPLRADESGLAQWAEVLQIPRRGAVGSARSRALEIRGEPGRVVAAGATLIHRTQARYRIPFAVTVPDAGRVLADVQAVTPGADTNLAAGDSLRFDEPPLGIEPGVRLVLDLENGRDQEPLGQWRARVVRRFREGDQSGTYGAYIALAESATPAVESAYVYANKPTIGSVSVAGLRGGRGPVRTLTPTERQQIAATIETKRPITDQVFVLETLPRVVHCDVRIATIGSARFDWSDSDEAYTVAAYDSDTALLQVSPHVPPTLSPGDLLTVASLTPDTSGADGAAAVVSAIIDDTTIALAPYGRRSQTLSWSPTVGDPIYAYSETADRVRNAILSGYSIGCGGEEFFDGIDTLGPANPGQQYGDWVSDLGRDRLQAAALSVPGVARVVVETPTDDVAPVAYAFPDDHVVEFLVPGQIIVRSMQ